MGNGFDRTVVYRIWQLVSGRDVVLIGGGMFLLFKATHEIHNSLEGVGDNAKNIVVTSMGMVLIQIAILDIVFSLDSS